MGESYEETTDRAARRGSNERGCDRGVCRICDEAYLALRRLLAHDEDEMAQERNAHEFLALEDEAKDAEIRRARESGAWTNWLSA